MRIRLGLKRLSNLKPSVTTLNFRQSHLLLLFLGPHRVGPLCEIFTPPLFNLIIYERLNTLIWAVSKAAFESCTFRCVISALPKDTSFISVLKLAVSVRWFRCRVFTDTLFAAGCKFCPYYMRVCIRKTLAELKVQVENRSC